MRTRPIYETAANRASEQDFARWLAARYFPGQHVEKLAMSYKLDFAVYGFHDGKRPHTLTAFVEYKDRSGRYAWSHFEQEGVYRLSLAKWAAARQLCTAADVPFYLAVKCQDGTYLARFTVAQMAAPNLCHDGRKDRFIYDPVTQERIPDPGDMEPMVEIPAVAFRREREGR